MSTFQNIVMVVAIIMLMICLTLVGVSLYNQKYTTAFPPVVADCPDYWLDKSNGDSSNCENVKNLGKDSCAKTMNFSTSSWTGDTGQCNKSRWARACDLTWDGITNNSSVCDGVPTVQPTTSGNTWTPGSFSLPGTASTSELAAMAVPSTTSTTSASSTTSDTLTPGSFSLPGTASTSELAAMAVPSQSS
jgi:hypothetical protein